MVGGRGEESVLRERRHDGPQRRVGQSYAAPRPLGLAAVAALALQGTEGFEERFQQAMSRGRELFQRLSTLPGLTVREFEHGSNIFPLTFADNVDQGKVAAGLRQRDILIYPKEGSDLISSLTVNTTILRQSNNTIFEAFRTALTNSR